MTTILNAPQDHTNEGAPKSTSRRHFLQVASSSAGALALELSFPAGTFAATTPATGVEVTAWVVVYPNDDIVIRVARSEMGQGSSTGLPMLVAEELECDWNRVKMEFAGVNEHIRRNRVWVSMGTGGSRSIRDSNEFLRKAGATSRTMLVTAASEQWKVPAEECVAANSVITHTPTGRKLRYGQVATAASKLTPPRDVKLKDPKDWKLIGKPVKRFDMPDKVLGKPIYGIDVQLPGMLYASLIQCPVFGGKLKSVDKTPAMNMRGVKQVVELPDAVAVVADNWWRANNAVKALKVEWDTGENGRASSDSIKAFLAAGFDTPMVVARKDGDVNAAFASAAKVVEAEYYVPYLNHATLEPQNATAWLRGDKLEVWAPTQNGEATIAVAAETAGLPLANVEVYKTQLGGGFGRRGAFQDWARYAVLVAKAVPGTPVKTLWTREEDMQHGAYRPASIARFKAGIDAQGKMTAWSSKFVATSIVATVSPAQIKDGLDPQFGAAFADSPYDVPNLLAESRIRTAHVPVGFWRSVFHSQNPYAREAFFDEVAKAGGRDPVEFRRELLVNSPDKAALKYLGVLDAVTKAAGWGSPAPAGVFRGVAVCDAYGSYAASVVELSVNASKVIDIKRVIVAADPGYAVNRDAALAQMEGNMIFGLTLVMYGENTVKDGRIEQSNFHDYQMARMRETPKFEGILMPSGGFWGGMGEPPLAPFIPAMANAVAAATGQPVRTLPLKNQGFKLSTAA